VPAATIFIYFFTPPFGQQFLLAHLLAKKKEDWGNGNKSRTEDIYNKKERKIRNVDG